MILRLKHVALAAKQLELFKPFFGEALKLDLSQRKVVPSFSLNSVDTIMVWQRRLLPFRIHHPPLLN